MFPILIQNKIEIGTEEFQQFIYTYTYISLANFSESCNPSVGVQVVP